MILYAQVQHAGKTVVKRELKAVEDHAHHLFIRQWQQDSQVDILLQRRQTSVAHAKARAR